MNGIYIDDEPRMGGLASRLESERLKITLREPAELTALANEVINQMPSVVILDYRLDQERGSQGGEPVTYRAAPLAQHMRDRMSDTPEQDFPIILISSEEKIQKMYRPEKTAHDLFDWKFVKTHVAESGEPAQILSGLADGYATLREHTENFDTLALFGLNDEDAYLVSFQELHESLKDAEYPHIAARYLLNFLLRRQGILLDSTSLYARLGILKPAGDELKALEDWLMPARYNGVFHGCGARWWSSLFEDLFSEMLGGEVGKFTATQRTEKLSSTLGQHFEAAKDKWTKSADFIPVFACACCGAATPLKHSLACFNERLPSFVQRQRVCYTCVLTDQLQEPRPYAGEDIDLRLDSDEQRIADRIRAGHLAPEAL